jgi:chemotaxis protein MotA
MFSAGGHSKQDYINALMLLNGVFYKIGSRGSCPSSRRGTTGKEHLFNKYPEILKTSGRLTLMTDTLRTVMTTTIAPIELEA